MVRAWYTIYVARVRVLLTLIIRPSTQHAHLSPAQIGISENGDMIRMTEELCQKWGEERTNAENGRNRTRSRILPMPIVRARTGKPITADNAEGAAYLAIDLQHAQQILEAVTAVCKWTSTGQKPQTGGKTTLQQLGSHHTTWDEQQLSNDRAAITRQTLLAIAGQYYSAELTYAVPGPKSAQTTSGLRSTRCFDAEHKIWTQYCKAESPSAQPGAAHFAKWTDLRRAANLNYGGDRQMVDGPTYYQRMGRPDRNPPRVRAYRPTFKLRYRLPSSICLVSNLAASSSSNSCLCCNSPDWDIDPQESPKILVVVVRLSTISSGVGWWVIKCIDAVASFCAATEGKFAFGGVMIATLGSDTTCAHSAKMVEEHRQAEATLFAALRGASKTPTEEKLVNPPVAKKVYRSYRAAQEWNLSFNRKPRFRSSREWHSATRDIADLPSSPSAFSRWKDDWVDWFTFLGIKATPGQRASAKAGGRAPPPGWKKNKKGCLFHSLSS